MAKIRSFEITPLAPEAAASLQALGRQIAQLRKGRRIAQKELAAQIGVGPQTMLFIEQGRPSVQIGHYARALSALGSRGLSSTPLRPEEVTPDTLSQPMRSSPQSSPAREESQGLEFAYNWSNAGMAEDALIRQVIRRGRFHDLAVICKRYGLERVRQAAGAGIDAQPRLRRSFENIERGFAHG